MAIKYVSGKTKELKVGLSSYSEGKPSLQVTGNVGVGTTNPLSLANPANTSVISAGIVTANKLYGDIVATGVGITNLFVSGISTFIGNVNVSAAGTVGFGTTAYFGYNSDFKIWDDDKVGEASKIHTNQMLELNSKAPGGFVGIRSEVTFSMGMGWGVLEADLIWFNTSSGQVLETDARNGGWIALKFGGSTKLKTYGDGVHITGNLDTDSLYNSGISTFDGASNFNDNVFVGTGATVGFGTTAFFPDNAAVYFGDSEDLKIYHDGSHSYIDDKGTGNLKLRSNNLRISNADESKLYAAFQAGAAELYHDNNLRLTSTASGIDITDTLHVAGISTFVGISRFFDIVSFNDDVKFFGNAAGITSAFWDKSANELKFYDGSKITLGDGQDLELSHNGTDSLIRDSRASGSVLRIGADKLWLQNKDGNEPYLEATDNGSVKLYHDFAPRFETTGIGISVAGIGSTAYIEGPSNIVIDPHPYGIGTTSGNVFIKGDLYVEGTEFIVDVDKIELGDFQIGIATTAGTNALLDGAGIGIGSTNIRKFITWNNATNALMTSENWNLASGKHYEINGTDVLTSDTLLVGTGASVHSPSNNILTLHTNGAEKLRIDASGNLGIGTAVPTDSANIANTSVTSAGIVTAVEYYGIFKGSIPGFSTVFSSGQGSFSATPGAPYTIDTFAFSTHDYQIAEYTLHFVHANGIQAQKALVMQDNSVAYSNEYGVMYDSELLVSIAATVSGGSVNITATPETGISGVTTFRWRREVQT